MYPILQIWNNFFQKFFQPLQKKKTKKKKKNTCTFKKNANSILGEAENFSTVFLWDKDKGQIWTSSEQAEIGLN